MLLPDPERPVTARNSPGGHVQVRVAQRVDRAVAAAGVLDADIGAGDRRSAGAGAPSVPGPLAQV